MAAFDAPANSDYRPFVDLGAARARFIRSNSEPLFETHAPLAMLGMLGAALPRLAENQTPLGAALADGLSAPPEANVSLPEAYLAYGDALRASRELLRSCKPGGPPAVLLEGAVGTAIAINDQLDQEKAVALWNTVRSGACYRSLAPELKTWVDLFAAVAARDAAAMSELGTKALANPPGEFARDYALAAAVVGEITLGRPEVGGRLLETIAPAQDKVWTMILREATAKRSIAPPRKP
jgi:hypothetical protein